MARVPLAPGPQVEDQVGSLPSREDVSAPQFTMGDFAMRKPADLITPQRKFIAKDGFTGDYNRYAPQPTTYADTASQGLMAFGQGLGKAGDAVGAIYSDVRTQANALVADNAVNKAKETALRLQYDKDGGFTQLKGYDALNRPDGKPLADEYGAKFDDAVKLISGDLKNDDQRFAFTRQALGIRNSLVSAAVQHETQEFRNYNLSTQDGTIKLETDNVGLNYRDPDAVNTSVERIKGAVAEQGLALGKSATWIAAAQRDSVSKAHSMALTAAIEDGNIVYADAYMKAHKDDMNADDILRTRGVITKELDGRIALSAAQDAVNIVKPQFDVTDNARLHNIVVAQESHGHEFNPGGTRVTSPKGARGIMQTMPATAAKPGYGLKPSDGTPADDARLGHEYLDAMIKLRSGDVPLALASYNAGPGRVDDAIKEAAAAGGGKTWLDFVPKETQDYVRNGVTAFGSGGGAPKTPTLADALAQIDADPRVNKSKARLDMARTEVTARFEALKAAKKSGDEDALADALKTVEANGGNYMGLTPAQRGAIPPEHIGTVMAFADKVRGGNTVTNMAVYQHLTDDSVLKHMSDSQFYAVRPELSPEDFKHFDEQRAKLIGATVTAGNAAGDLNTPALRMTVNDRLQMLGINPTPKATDKDGMSHVGAINKFVTDQTLLAQQQLGRKFTDAEQSAFVDKLFSKSAPFRNTVLGITVGHDNQRLLAMSPGDIPADARSKLQDAFKKRGINNPSDTDLLSAYWRTRMLAGG